MPETLTVRAWFRRQRAQLWTGSDTHLASDLDAIADLIAKGHSAAPWLSVDVFVVQGPLGTGPLLAHAHDEARVRLDRLIYDVTGRPRPRRSLPRMRPGQEIWR